MSRNRLHKNKLDAFKAWLDAAGIAHRPGRGAYQVLQVALPHNQWGVVYDRDTAPEHYTATAPLDSIVSRFIREKRRIKPADGPKEVSDDNS